MTTHFLTAALLATTALLPMAAFAGSDYGSMPVEGITMNSNGGTTVASTQPTGTTTNTSSGTNVASTAASLNDTAPSSGAAGKYYIEGRAGWSKLSPSDDDTDNAIPFGAAVGYHLSPNTRVEGEVSYRKYDYSNTISGTTFAGSGDEQHLSAMLNGYYDFTNSSRLTPYLGAGIGFDRTSVDMSYTDGVDTVAIDDSDIAFTYALMAGASYAVTNNVDLTLGYRWFDTSKASMAVTDTASGNYTLDSDTRAHEVLAGVRYNF